MKTFTRFVTSIYRQIRFVMYRISVRFAEMMVLISLAVYYFTETLVLTLTPSSLRAEKSLRGRIVLVTGGAGGIGQELVLRLVRQDAKVIVWDKNEKAMEKLKIRVKKEGHDVNTYSVDISEKDIVYKYAAIVKSDIGKVDVVINNAGVVCGQTFLEIPDYMIEKTYKINILSHYWIAKAFLPDMIKKKYGHIVTISSLTGLLGTYKCTDYSASKFATVGFHESLLTELKSHGHNYIKMSLVCPYFINTGMFEGCKPKMLPMLDPKDVAKRIITAIRREEVFITIPTFSRFVLPLKNYIPAKLSWAMLYKVIQGPQSMMGMRSFHEIEAA